MFTIKQGRKQASLFRQSCIHVNVDGHGLDQEVLNLDVALTLSLSDFKAYVNDVTSISTDRLLFIHNGRPLIGETTTLAQLGINDGEMLALVTSEQEQPQGQPQETASSARGPADMGAPDEIESIRRRLLQVPHDLATIRRSRPDLAAAVNDPARFRRLYEELLRQQKEEVRERERQIVELNKDPFNMEAQQKIAELIRQDRVTENLQHAMEHNPEVFGHVTMLYINVTVNGHAVKAFVDSGAQTTIMSPSCAETCNIMRLVDNRYSGVAHGVGTAKILGRVHSADIRIGKATMPCSFTVMEGKGVDLLLGLDMLKRHQASIDLKRNKLVFEDNEIDFLPESDIPKWMDAAQKAEPTITGPEGSQIGVKSGTVKSAVETGNGKASASTNGNFKGSGQTLASDAAVAQTPPSSVTSSSTPSATTGQAAQSATSSYEEEDINKLIGLGFGRKEAIAALHASNGNVEYAAGLLFGGE